MTAMWQARGLWRAAALLAVVGCDTADDTADAGAGPAVWRLSDTPRVSIGVVDGDERYQLVFVTSAWRQDDGRIVVIDGGKPALLFYDSGGTFLSQVGRAGEGPGEMQSRVGGWPYRGDSIATYDLMLRRVSVYDRDGNFARSFNNPVRYERKPNVMPSQSCCSISGVFADGSFVGHPPDDIPIHPGPPRHSTVTPVRVSADGARQDTIGTFESRLFYHDPGSRSGVTGYVTSYAFRYVVVGDRLIGGDGLRSRLVSVSLATADDAISDRSFDTIPLPREPEAFTAELRTAYEDALRADYELRGSRGYEGSLESHLGGTYPATAPGFVNMFADADGHVWLQRWTPDYGRTGARLDYDVVTQDGAHIASIELPTGSRLLWAGNGQLMLLERDDLDVQYVRLYDLVRSES
jgi:hypothetical protein